MVLVALLLPASGEAVAPLRTYLTVNGGAHVLNTNLDGDVVRDRATGLVELGIGHEFGPRMAIEATYGWMGEYQQPPPIRPLLADEPYASDAERAFRVTVNPAILRLRYARDGMRTGYFKPEFAAGLGFYQVTRLLRNLVSVPPEQTSQLLPAVELGIAALFVFDKNFMGYAGTRYALMQRRDIVDSTRHFDGLSVLLGFRVFLPSPRDERERLVPSAP